MSVKKQVLIVIIILITLSGCAPKEIKTAEMDYFYFGTSINVKIYYQDENKYDFAEIEAGIDQILAKLQQEFDPTEADTLISQLNKTGELTMSSDFEKVYDKSVDACQITEGHFDATSGELIDLWSINDQNHLPTSTEIKTALSTIGCDEVEVNDNKIRIPAGMKLNFGSIVKGYAADKIEAYLHEHDVESALLNLGGNVQTIGQKLDGSEFRIGVMRPEIDNELNENALIITSSDEAVVTSGINQRFFVVNNQLYHHILDAKVGKPVDNELASVTIITDEGINADTLSTVTFIKGLVEGYKYIESLPGVEAIFITKNREFYTTNDNLEIEIVDDTYQLRKFE